MQPPPQSASTPGRPPDRLVVGRVLGPWGVSGQVRVESLSDTPTRFSPGNRFLIGTDVYVCQEARPHGRYLVVRLRGVEGREAASRLNGSLLEIPAHEAPAPPPGAYYHHQVLGLQVWTTDGRLLGTVADILETGGNDVYVVRGPGGEVLVPAIADVVVSLDLEAGRLTIDPVPGLLP